jgi:hypothetical protein
VVIAKMLYCRVPIINGKLDIDYSTCVEAHAISDTEAVAQLRANELRQSWAPITQEKFESYRPPTPTFDPVIVDEPVDEEKAAMAEAIIAHDAEIEALKAEIQTLKGGVV